MERSISHVWNRIATSTMPPEENLQNTMHAMGEHLQNTMHAMGEHLQNTMRDAVVVLLTQYIQTIQSHGNSKAAADSSAYQPSTTQPPSMVGQDPKSLFNGYSISNATSSLQHQQSTSDMHFQPYMHGNDQYYHHQSIEHGLQPSSQKEDNAEPLNRYEQMLNQEQSNSINSSASPRRTPIQHSSTMQSTSPSNPLIPTKPTPSTSPNQCHLCGHICETFLELSKHYATAHGSGHNESNRPVGSNEETEISSSPYNHFIKKEEPCDIFDVDVDPLNDEPIQQSPLSRPIHRSLNWSHDHHAFIPPQPQDVKPLLFAKPLQELLSSTVTKNGTATRKNNVTATRNRPYWKPNEARRPKTWNCIVCNKWFSSSGFLGRHYKALPHKVAVASSGQPDPGTMLISSHHHSARDHNKNNHGGSSAQAPTAPALLEYSTHFTSPLGFQETQGFQQYETAQMHPTTGSSLNGEAGHSVLAFQSRPLPISLNNTGTQQVIPEQEQTFMQQTNSPDPFNITTAPYQEQELIPGSDADEMDKVKIEIEVSSANMMDRPISPYSKSFPCTGAIPRSVGGVATYKRNMASSFSAKPSPRIALGSLCISSTENEDNHAGTKLECVQCSKVFQKACYLTVHNNTYHSVEKPFNCIRCNDKFPCRKTYEEHVAQHSPEKPLKCNQCIKRFNKLEDLGRHMVLHVGPKPYMCRLCPRVSFARRDDLMKHAETHR